jgi:hypothetical protein
MISLEGLTLVTGRQREAGYILRAFAHDVRDGLIPNYFPDGKNQGVYHTADATLWFFHAIARYVDVSGDRDTLRALPPKLRAIVDAHVRGTDFGIRVDPADGLLGQGAAGYQLTWMDAKVGEWVVTTRRGKAVEINALWYNALRLLEGWLRDAGDAARGEGGRRAGRPGFRLVQRPVLVRHGRLPLRRRRWPGRRRLEMPAQPDLRRLAAPPGPRPRARGVGRRRGRGAAGHAGRAALAGARRPGIQGAL